MSAAALSDLTAMLATPYEAFDDPELSGSEGRQQSLIREEAAGYKIRLFRNNVGVLKDVNGTPVRFGLANDTPKVNKVFKSGDLIGWREKYITHQMVGTVIAQFVSREIKKVGWTYSGTAHEKAQANWATLVNSCGGDAKFASGKGSFNE